MDDQTPEQALDAWLKSDSEAVDAFNSEWRYTTPPIELRIQVIEQRLAHALSCIAVIMRKTIRTSHSAGVKVEP